MPWFRTRPHTSPPSVGTDASVLVSDDPGFVLVDGRRHHASAPYPLPKDGTEIDRLDFQHFLLRYGMQGLYRAPIDAPQRILDVGTGSGRWAIEMASIHSHAAVIGVDLDPPEPSPTVRAQWPPNVTFVVGNVLEGIRQADALFDFVHMRLLVFAIPMERWPSVVDELVRVTQPGGWVELTECGVPTGCGPHTTAAWQFLLDIAGRRQVDARAGVFIGDLLRYRSKLQRVEAIRLDFPLGSWGGRIGQMGATDLLAGVSAVRGLVLAADPPLVLHDELLAVRPDWRRRSGPTPVTETVFDDIYTRAVAEFGGSFRGVMPLYVAWGQRAPHPR